MGMSCEAIDLRQTVDRSLPVGLACLDGLLAFSAVALASLAPKMLGSYRQRFAVYIWIGVMIFVFSYLVKVFKYKNGGRSKWLARVRNIAELIRGVFGLDRLPVPSFPRIDVVVIYMSDRNKHKCSCSWHRSAVAAVC